MNPVTEPPVFTQLTDLAAERLGGKTLSCTDDFFAEMENLTRRLSDTYLDLDLLDQQARSVLGMIRADEIVIR